MYSLTSRRRYRQPSPPGGVRKLRNRCTDSIGTTVRIRAESAAVRGAGFSSWGRKTGPTPSGPTFALVAAAGLPPGRVADLLAADGSARWCCCRSSAGQAAASGSAGRHSSRRRRCRHRRRGGCIALTVLVAFLAIPAAVELVTAPAGGGVSGAVPGREDGPGSLAVSTATGRWSAVLLAGSLALPGLGAALPLRLLPRPDGETAARGGQRALGCWTLDIWSASILVTR